MRRWMFVVPQAISTLSLPSQVRTPLGLTAVTGDRSGAGTGGVPATTATALARAAPGVRMRGLRRSITPWRSHTSRGRPSRRPNATTVAAANPTIPATIHTTGGSSGP
ncbi:hypothetical protein AB0I90_15645 [Micromonospora wenchangensis]|uniref:hypothetical protein n=1 Tax=Micromonospora wenchangensis TaxID=1185415 RepID=UPI0033CACB7D